MLIYLIPVLVFAALALMHKVLNIRFGKWLYAAALLYLAVFSGLRDEVGATDWEAYKQYYDYIAIRGHIYDNYWSSSYQQFEIGFYFLNYLVKLTGLGYVAVQLFSTLVLSTAIYLLTRDLSINRFYFLTVFASYSYLILTFAQVRQSLAVSCVRVGLLCFLRTGKKHRAVLIAFTGCLFQYTALMYIVPLAFVLYTASISRRAIIRVILALLLLLLVISKNVDYYSVLANLAFTASAQDKVEIYRETQTASQGSGQVIYVAYLLLLAGFFYFMGNEDDIRERVIGRFTICAIALSALLSWLFPGSYVMYSRIYVIACICHGLFFAMIDSRATHRKMVINVIFMISIGISVFFFARQVNLYSDEYIPYRSIFAR